MVFINDEIKHVKAQKSWFLGALQQGHLYHLPKLALAWQRMLGQPGATRLLEELAENVHPNQSPGAEWSYVQTAQSSLERI